MDKDFDEALAKALASGDEVPEALLEGLSGLDGVALRRFHDVWERLDADSRADLLERLGELGATNLALDYQPIYAAALSDGDATVRERALLLAAEEANPALLETYLRAAIADPDEDVRLSAVEALGQFALAAQADDWPQETWRQIETALLGVLKLPSTDAPMRRAALLSVAYLTTDAVEAEIRRAHQDVGMRDVAIEAMGRNCQPLWIPSLSEALDDEDAAIREAAVGAAAELEDEALIPRLLPRLDDEDDVVRLASIAALGTIGGPVAKEALTELLTSGERQLRDAAREALQALLDEENPLSA
jgi:HEAT repeat protein